ncbi:MAG: signal peptidase II [Rickettsiales bacterium]|nr:signal peptidase II [Rickettsiales bacterium]
MNIFKEKKLFFLGIFIAFLVVFFDLLTKRITFAILENIAFEQITKHPEIKVTSFFNLAYVWNYGVSFGMFNNVENSQIIFCLLQSSIAVILAFWMYNNNKTHVTYALAFIIGGALGNSIDRAKNGAVADFLDFHIASYHWPAFNLADSFVFIGVMILVFEDFIFKKK